MKILPEPRPAGEPIPGITAVYCIPGLLRPYITKTRTGVYSAWTRLQMLAFFGEPLARRLFAAAIVLEDDDEQDDMSIPGGSA